MINEIMLTTLPGVVVAGPYYNLLQLLHNSFHFCSLLAVFVTQNPRFTLDTINYPPNTNFLSGSRHEPPPPVEANSFKVLRLAPDTAQRGGML